MSSERTPIYTSRLAFLAVARSARAGSETLRARSPNGVRSSLKPTDLPLTFLPAARTLQTHRNARTNHCGKARCSPLNRLAKQRVSFCRNRRLLLREYINQKCFILNTTYFVVFYVCVYKIIAIVLSFCLFGWVLVARKKAEVNGKN